MGWLYMAGLGCVAVVVRCLGSGLPGEWIAVVCIASDCRAALFDFCLGRRKHLGRVYSSRYQ